MDSGTESLTTRHFACTRCGKCCNRAPELELGEAAAYSDIFVLQLLMRIYSLPRNVADYESPLPGSEARAQYYESKRLLGLYSATSWNARVRRGERVVEYIQYLNLSVLPLDVGTAGCPALAGDSCGIYGRRPLSCRSVPLHYSRPAATAHRDVDSFVASPGFRCATGTDAPLIVSAGTLVDSALSAARNDAAIQALADRQWKAALVKAMKASQHGLPTPGEVEAQAGRGALSVSMVSAWKVAVSAGLLDAAAALALVASQAALIEGAIERGALPAESMTALAQQLLVYREARF